MKAFCGSILDRLRVRADARSDGHPAASIDAAFATLVAPLPPFARDAFVRRAARGGPLPQSAADLFQLVKGWAIGAGIAEGRGGYPGGRGKPGWTDYVELQREHVAIFRALVDVFGEPSPSLAESLRDYERSFPPPVRRMGEGYAPHVDDVAGRLVYSLPVDSGVVGSAFSFPITERDLGVLLADPYRRAVLEAVAHTVLQRSMIRGNPEVTEIAFHRIVNESLHSTPDDLKRFIAGVDRAHNIRIDTYARAAMERRAAGADSSGRQPPCGS